MTSSEYKHKLQMYYWTMELYKNKLDQKPYSEMSSMEREMEAIHFREEESRRNKIDRAKRIFNKKKRKRFLSCLCFN